MKNTEIRQVHPDAYDVIVDGVMVFTKSAQLFAVTCKGKATALAVKRINQALVACGIDWAKAYRRTVDGDMRAYLEIDGKWRVDVTWKSATVDISLRNGADEITGRMPILFGHVEYVPQRTGSVDVIWPDYFPLKVVRIYNNRARWQEVKYAKPEYSDFEMAYIVHNDSRVYLENFSRTPKDGPFADYDGIAPDSFFSGLLIKFDPQDSGYAKVRGYSC